MERAKDGPVEHGPVAFEPMRVLYSSDILAGQKPNAVLIEPLYPKLLHILVIPNRGFP